MFSPARRLLYPLRIIGWLTESIYKNNPALRAEAEQATHDMYTKTPSLEARNVEKAIVRYGYAVSRTAIPSLTLNCSGGKHNDPQNPDPKGDHWTVDFLTAEEEFVTRRHVYPEGKN